MKFLSALLTVAACLAPDLPAADVDRVQEEAAVRQAIANYVNAYNAKDVVAIWKTVAPTLESRNPYSGQLVQAGPKFFQESFSGNPGHRWQRSPQSVRFLSPDVAQVDGKGEDSGRLSPQRTSLPPLKLYFVYLLKKEQGQWRIASTRIWTPTMETARNRE